MKTTVNEFRGLEPCQSSVILALEDAADMIRSLPLNISREEIAVLVEESWRLK